MELTQFLIAILGMLFPIGILAIIFGYQNRSEARFHETVQRAIESGQTLDENLMSGIPGYKKAMPRNDIRSGLITAGVGLGLILLGYMAMGSMFYGAGYLVLFIGLPIFAYGIYNKVNNPSADSED